MQRNISNARRQFNVRLSVHLSTPNTNPVFGSEHKICAYIFTRVYAHLKGATRGIFEYFEGIEVQYLMVAPVIHHAEECVFQVLSPAATGVYRTIGPGERAKRVHNASLSVVVIEITTISRPS